MDEFPIETVMCIFEVLPDGPTKTYIRTQAGENHERGQSEEAALREAMTSVFRTRSAEECLEILTAFVNYTAERVTPLTEMSFVGLIVVDRLLPGPTADYVGGLGRENRERGMPTRDSLSDALTRALATPEHRFGVLAALVSYAAGETAKRVPCKLAGTRRGR